MQRRKSGFAVVPSHLPSGCSPTGGPHSPRLSPCCSVFVPTPWASDVTIVSVSSDSIVGGKGRTYSSLQPPGAAQTALCVESDVS